MNRILKIAHRCHKILGLILLLFFVWMSISGILLNHKSLISNLSVPAWLTPQHYYINNWSRGALLGTTLVNDTVSLAYGSQGVYISTDRGRCFSSYMGEGFPRSAWNKRTNHVVYDNRNTTIYAATNAGLLKRNVNNGNWAQQALIEDGASVKKLFLRGDSLVVFTDSDILVLVNDTIQKITPRKPKTVSVSMIEVFFQLHDGSIWGFPGKLLWDAVAIVLLFLCISAIYIWFLPKKWKYNWKNNRIQKAPAEVSRFKFHAKHHGKWGWYFGVIILIIVITGTFLRPPFMMALGGASIKKQYYPSIENKNPWHNKIKNVAHNSLTDKYIIESSDGIFSGRLSDSIFTKTNINVPIFAMGTTVFEEHTPGVFYVGSFGGLFLYNSISDSSRPLLQIKSQQQAMRPSSIMVCGIVTLPNDSLLVVDQYKGICSLHGTPFNTSFHQSASLSTDFRMPLWNYLFEIHNGRFFKGVIGDFYALIIPLGGLLSIFLIITGLLVYGIPFFKTVLKRKL